MAAIAPAHRRHSAGTHSGDQGSREGAREFGTVAGMDPAETVDQRWTRPKQADGAPVPGLVLIFTAGQPRLDAIPLDATPLLVRRGPVGPVVLDDACLSRRHAEVWFARGELHVRDLGSRNGTALDGIAVSGERTAG